MASFDRIIAAEKLGEVTPVRLEELHADNRRHDLVTKLRTAAGAGSEPPPAFRDGFRRGMQEGMRRGALSAAESLQREHGARLQTLTNQFAARAKSLTDSMDAGLAQVREELAADALRLGLEIARQVIRAEIRSQPQLVEAAVREAVGHLVDERSSFVLHLHPDDVAALGEALEPVLQARGSRIQPDPAIAPGGCRIVAPEAEIDATLGTRWQRVLAAIGMAGEMPDPDTRP